MNKRLKRKKYLFTSIVILLNLEVVSALDYQQISMNNEVADIKSFLSR